MKIIVRTRLNKNGWVLVSISTILVVAIIIIVHSTNNPVTLQNDLYNEDMFSSEQNSKTRLGRVDYSKISYIPEPFLTEPIQLNIRFRVNPNASIDNPEEAEKQILYIVNDLINHLDKKHDVILYVLGTSSDNRDARLDQSQIRANLVRDLLIRNGIDRHRIEAHGLGKRYPNRIREDTPDASRRNRFPILMFSDITDQELFDEINTLIRGQ